jgi:hypothetical protein
MPWANPSPLVLHHGTVDLYVPSILRAINPAVGRHSTDFSTGFYTTTNVRQARAHARNLLHRKRSVGARRGVVLTFSVDRNAMAALQLTAFARPSHDFWELVDWCRAGNGSHHAGGFYDIVVGPVSRKPRRTGTHRGYDQVSFHTGSAVQILVNPKQQYLR